MSGLDELLIESQRELIATQDRHIQRLTSALVALADAADKCAGAPHFIVQPFLGLYREHGETIAKARESAASAGEAGTSTDSEAGVAEGEHATEQSEGAPK